MRMKESRHVYISVEGDVCEIQYFRHLKNLINSDSKSRYKLNLSIKKTDPYSYIKQNCYKPMDKMGKETVPFFHIQDIEDYSDTKFNKQFKSLVDIMRKAEDEFDIPSFLGYSNYTFELWMLLHVSAMSSPVSNRNSYLQHINKFFNKKYQGLDEYKDEKEFIDILEKHITLDSVFLAIDRAEDICVRKKADNQRLEQYRKVDIYPDNPYTTVHEVAKCIFRLCGVPRR